MYALEERIKAVDLYFRYGRKASAVIRELGYPDRKILVKWVREYEETGKLHERCAGSNRYSQEEKPEGLLFHSDRGSEYTCKEFRDLLDQCSVLQSFSAKGYPYDNSVCESFFKYLKMEETDRKHYRTREELRLDLFSYIDGYYNSKRIHSSIGYKTPNEIEKEFFMNNC